jgi:ATP-binding cassette, subfamily B, multidrug efflux pump
MSSVAPHDEEESFTLEPSLRRRLLWAYFRRYRGLFALGALFLILTNLLALAIPYYLGDAVQTLRDAATGEATDLTAVREHVVGAAFVIIWLAIGAGVARVFSRITIFNAGRHIEFDVRNELYEHAARLSPKFYHSIATGDLTSRVTNDVTYVRLLYAITYLHIINAIVAYGIAIQRMAAIDLTLTLLCLAPYPVLLYGVRNVIRALFEQTKIVQAELSNLSSRVQENLTGVDVIKSYVLQDREIATFRQANNSFFRENVVLARVRATLQAAIALIASAGTLVVLVVGSRRVIDGSMTLGAFVEFNAYVVALVFPTIALGWVLSIWHRGLAGFDRVSEILQREPILADPGEEGTPLPDPSSGNIGGVELRGVSFAYDDDDQALQNIDLEIEAGTTVAIVGKTGAGKSTLAQLIARMHDPDTGEILIDGIPLRQCSLRQLRAEIGFVPQEPFLFSMSIGQNIRFGLDSLAYDGTLDKHPPDQPLLPAADGNTAAVTQEDRIAEAAEIASLTTDIQGFREGLDTMVGERGVTLSGGQKQRVTIARALLVDPRILILDDALASVDTRTERRILEQLKTIMAGRTSILITHRFNALSEVDRVFVLDHGELIESGTHQELIEAGGYYADMYHRQKLREELDATEDS